MKTGRNEPCTCGSGKKFKKCCGNPVNANRRATEVKPQKGKPFHRTLIQERNPVEITKTEFGVITPSSEIHGVKDGVWNISAYLEPQNLRYFALYWDKILLTESDLSVTVLNEEQQLLADAGLLGKYSSRVLVDISRAVPDAMDDIYVDAMSEIAFELEKRNPGRWTIHHPECLTLKGSKTAELYTAKVELMNCLPLPKNNVRLDKLLDFKMRRKSELLGLRLTLAELYGSIAATNDIPHSKTAEVTRLEKAIYDLNASDSDGIFGNFAIRRSTVVDVGLKEVSFGAATGFVAGAQWSSDPFVGLASAAVGSVAGALSGIKFELGVSQQMKNSSNLDLSYISAMKEEGVVQK